MNSGNPSVANTTDICIAANFTAEPIEGFLTFWMKELAIPASIRFAPYNQVFQQLLEGGLLRSNRAGINLVALDLDAWLVESPIDQARDHLTRTISSFIDALRAAGALGAGGAVLLFPTDSGGSGERIEAVAAARARLQAEGLSIQGWSVIDLSEAATRYAVVETRDPFTNELGNIPFTEEMYAAAATAAARWIRTTCTKPPKVIVLDCDNTLWQGICGEVAVQVTEPFRRLQEFMLRQQENGVLLAVASKNNEADVMAVLESDACLLRPEHLTAWRINWQPKSENLAALAEELGLALNSFVFLDDSPYECLEVRNQCPDVTTIQLPDSEAIPGFLEHLWVFDRPAATDEDRNRSKMYQAQRQRAELSRAMTPEAFLESLRLEVDIKPATPPELARVAQLTHRTTQFNLTGAMHTEQTLTAMLAQGEHECWTVRVRDVFGDYGLVGVVLFERKPDGLRVENFLLSCRALGRRVEDRMVEELRRRAIECDVDRLIIPVVPTARNRPAREFLNRMCGAPAEASEPFECMLSADGNSAEYRQSTATVQSASGALQPAAPQSPAPLPTCSNQQDDLVRFATQLCTAAAVVSAARTTMKQRPATAMPAVAPRDPIEASLARIWSECLSVEPIGIQDNFFDFGGHSLMATRVLTKARAEFGVELSLTKFFEAPTVEGMAASIARSLPVALAAQ
jgi:FkbH-like protein